MLVWLPAPSLNLSGVGGGALKQNAVSKFFASCPDNAFQVPSAVTLPTSPYADLQHSCCGVTQLLRSSSAEQLMAHSCWLQRPMDVDPNRKNGAIHDTCVSSESRWNDSPHTGCR